MTRTIQYLACTRPTMKLGVTFEGYVINFCICGFSFIYIAQFNPLSWRGVISLLLLPVLHVIMRILIDIDHNMFRIIRLMAETRGLQFCSISVLRAMRWRPPAKAKDVISAV